MLLVLKYNPDNQFKMQSPADAIIKVTGNFFSLHSMPDTSSLLPAGKGF